MPGSGDIVRNKTYPRGIYFLAEETKSTNKHNTIHYN